MATVVEVMATDRCLFSPFRWDVGQDPFSSPGNRIESERSRSSLDNRAKFKLYSYDATMRLVARAASAPEKKEQKKEGSISVFPSNLRSGRCHASYCALTPQGSNPMRGKRRNLEKRAGLQEFAIYYIVEPFRTESLLKAKCTPLRH